jgi:hypothetical protein
MLQLAYMDLSTVYTSRICDCFHQLIQLLLIVYSSNMHTVVHYFIHDTD